MGNKFFDKFFYLHIATGIMSYFLNISFINAIILHIIFEIVENSKQGIRFINNYLTFWPGGKPRSDTFINSFGDTVAFALGWKIAQFSSLR
jgi:hypothetical protein